MDSFYHVSVLREESLENLNLKDGGVYVDCTLGAGGHSLEILKRTSSSRLICVDKDQSAIDFCREKLADYAERVTFVKSDFVNTAEILAEAGVQKVDGVLMDLGVSSPQLDDFERGFSYRAEDAALDMRMDRSQSLSAYEVVNGYTREELTRILYEYGEEKFSRKIADNIVSAREREPICTCGQLCDLIYKSIPEAARRKGGHPAKRTFQAIRIEVNGELANLKEAVENWTRALKQGGRICVITFHSLEDRIVKQTLNYMALDCICDKRAPKCVCGKVSEVEVITRKPILPSEDECRNNPRAESAKLRVAQKKE